MTGMWWGKVLQRGDDGLWLDGVYVPPCNTCTSGTSPGSNLG